MSLGRNASREKRVSLTSQTTTFSITGLLTVVMICSDDSAVSNLAILILLESVGPESNS